MNCCSIVEAFYVIYLWYFEYIPSVLVISRLARNNILCLHYLRKKAEEEVKNKPKK